MLLLTGCTALALTVERLLVNEDLTPAGRVARTAYCFIYGLALTGLCVFLWRRLRGAATIHHPGHALLVLAGFGAVIDGGVEAGVRFFSWLAQAERSDIVNGYWMWYVRWLWHQAIGYLLVTAIALWLFFITSAPLRWKISFGALLATFAIQCVAYFLALAVILGWIPAFAHSDALPPVSMLVCSLGCTAIIVVSIVIDVQRRTLRDWMHYCGLAVALLLAGMEWIRFWQLVANGFFA